MAASDVELIKKIIISIMLQFLRANCKIRIGYTTNVYSRMNLSLPG